MLSGTLIDMKYSLRVIITMSFFIFMHQEIYAGHREAPVTPYGDICPLCGKYGTCKSMMTSYEAHKAMKDYYDKKGLEVSIDNARGRFVRARIIHYGEVVDVIIFDRLTGRVRSIF
ncbi:MAG: hypothetical protein C4560_02360 [Nitrospiraceae bacterium]|nr:MAG: hypothetical protein C4560_02360 [Nitrospiraceae bacterium]